mgnify:CR=1 FL=1|nr:MAG TPA: antitoxin [Caudoviricetes sp.]
MRNVKITSITVTDEQTRQVKEIMEVSGWSFSEAVRRCVGACYAELKRTNRLKKGNKKNGKME